MLLLAVKDVNFWGIKSDTLVFVFAHKKGSNEMISFVKKQDKNIGRGFRPRCQC